MNYTMTIFLHRSSLDARIFFDAMRCVDLHRRCIEFSMHRPPLDSKAANILQ